MRKLVNKLLVRNRLGDRRGAAAALMAVMLIAMLAVMAVAVDVTRLMSTRAELQTAVDAAAHAGALELSAGSGDISRDTAIAYGARNYAENEPVTVAPEDVVFGVWDPDARSFTPLPGAAGADAVHVRARKQVTNWVAWALNILNTTPVAEAIAWSGANVVHTDCVKPWAIPEEVMDMNGDGDVTDFEATETSAQGREFVLKGSSTGETYTGLPSFFYPVVLPSYWDESEQQYNDLSGETGAAEYRENIGSCVTEPIGVGDSLLVEPGNMPGPTIQGARDFCYQIVNDYCLDENGEHPTIIAAFWDSEVDPIGRTTVGVARLGSFDLVKVYSQSAHAVVVGRLKEFVTTGGVGSASTNLHTVILVR